MVKIKINDEKYRYNVYVILSLFFGLNNIKFVNDNNNYNYNINIDKHKIVINNSSDNNLEKFNFNDKNLIKEEIKRFLFLYFKKVTGKELPWGILVGIRPTKIALNLLELGWNEEKIIQYFEEHYLTREDKVKLCINVAKKESKLVFAKKDVISIYIGMPFCPTKCLYCSFTSNAINKNTVIVNEYLEALKHEIYALKKYIDDKSLSIDCVYFGGGTPTSVSNNQFHEVLKEIYLSFVKDRYIREFNVECGRPDSITIEKLKIMKSYGVNRISINPQTMNDKTLKTIGRYHSSLDIIEKFHMARELDFENINMDIIVGLPGENLDYIKKTCEEIFKLSPDSITVHGMSIKRGSKLYEEIINNAQFSIPMQNELNIMFETTSNLAKNLNMEPYYMYRQKNMVGNMENIGYCKEKKEGIYNIQMIEEKQTIIALGADAVSKVVFLEENRIERFSNVKDIKEYINRIDEMIEKKIFLLNTLY